MRSLASRLPPRLTLWLALVPLLAGGLVYYLLWSGWATAFRTEIGVWLPGSAIAVSGFPYRIEASIDAPRLTGRDMIAYDLGASRAVVNRGPWQPELTVVQTAAPRASVAVGGTGAATAMRADLGGISALTSINVAGGEVIRLSSVIEAARGRLGILTPPLAADTLQIHLREVSGRLPEPWSPTLPGRGQAVISAERLRIGGGDALTLASDIAVTGAGRLNSFTRWADGGTIEIRALTLADAHGEVAAVKATLVPVGLIGVRMAGTITTVCPESVIAAFMGQLAAKALRLRSPVQLAFEASAGVTPFVNVTGVPADLATRPRRAQEDACPVLRGRD